MRITIIIAAGIALGGCATAAKVPLSNGVEGYAIECPRIKQCYRKAAQICAPAQYESLGQGGPQTSGGFANGVGAIGSSTSLTIVCKK